MTYSTILPVEDKPWFTVLGRGIGTLIGLLLLSVREPRAPKGSG